MATLSLDHHASAINLSLDSLDHLHELVDKSYALVHVAMSDHFAVCGNNIIENYLGTLGDLLCDVKRTLEKIEEEQPDITVML